MQPIDSSTGHENAQKFDWKTQQNFLRLREQFLLHARLDDSEFFELEASPVEGQSLQ